MCNCNSWPEAGRSIAGQSRAAHQAGREGAPYRSAARKRPHGGRKRRGGCPPLPAPWRTRMCHPPPPSWPRPPVVHALPAAARTGTPNPPPVQHQLLEKAKELHQSIDHFSSNTCKYFIEGNAETATQMSWSRHGQLKATRMPGVRIATITLPIYEY